MQGELVDFVNDSDEIVGKGTKEEKISKGLLTRNVAIFVFEEASRRLVIAKRSPSKRTFPGKFDLSVAGNVSSGEEPEAAAIRELKEELGVAGANPVLLGKLRNELGNLKYFTYIFTCRAKGPFRANEELSELRQVSLSELGALVEKSPSDFVPFFLSDFYFVREKLSSFLELEGR